MSDMTMGQRIAEQRKKLGLSQEALGEKVGVSRQAISKWESDGAVPEIDKLISLSKLFSVCVGWLLGVEESTPPQSDDLTETQIKMVEEIVRRYQPAPEPEEKEPPWFHFVLILLFLIPIIYTLFSLYGPGKTDYSDQISSLQANYQAIQSQLQSLSGKVEDIASAAENSEKLLQSHEFQLLELGKGGSSLDPVTEENLQDEELPEDVIPVTVDVPIAELRFTAVPSQRAESDQAWLVVLLEGKPHGQVECAWSGAGYTAEFSLWLADGYEYRFVVERADGTQQIQVLEEFTYDALAYNTSLHCTVDSFVWKYDPRSWVFRVSDCWILAEKPILGNYDDTRWTESGLIFYRNGEEAERIVLPVGEENAGDHKLLRGYIDSDASLRTFKPEEGDELKLTFYAALDNGMSVESTISQWVFKNGQLLLMP